MISIFFFFELYIRDMLLVSFLAQTLRSEKTGHGQGGMARDLTQTSLHLPSPFPFLSLSFISFFFIAVMK